MRIDAKDKANAKRKAFTRALKQARDKELIGSREIGGIDYLWLVDLKPGTGVRDERFTLHAAWNGTGQAGHPGGQTGHSLVSCPVCPVSGHGTERDNVPNVPNVPLAVQYKKLRAAALAAARGPEHLS